METDYVRPSAGVLEGLVAATLAEAGVQAAPAEWEWVESGSSSIVVLAGPAAVRVARDAWTTPAVLRTQRLVDALPRLPFPVPISIGDAVHDGGLVAAPTRRLSGSAHPPGSGDPAELRALLDAVHSLPPAELRPHLAPARSFCGGPDWEHVLREQVVPALPPDVRDEARHRIDALAGLAIGDVVVNHGDLASSNVLWADGRVSGLLDWDLTSEEDPAEDVASLLSWHGWHLLHEVVDSATAARAEAFRGCFPLQIVAFSLLRRRPAHELARMVERATGKLRR
ncbi:phosphotransferase family protein [Georgenia sp. MJ170]|uniref:phosphotransferase family protein n=1 Tax=Georgenia sunbinii TaxID=3117728 RepID=UPI002F263CC4